MSLHVNLFLKVHISETVNDIYFELQILVLYHAETTNDKGTVVQKFKLKIVYILNYKDLMLSKFITNSADFSLQNLVHPSKDVAPVA